MLRKPDTPAGIIATSSLGDSRLAEILTLSPQAVFALDRSGRITYANPRGVALLDMPHKKIPGCDLFAVLISRGNRRRVRIHFKKILLGADTYGNLNVSFKAKDGQDLSAGMMRILDASGKPAGVIMTLIPAVSEPETARESKLNAHLQSLFVEAPIPIWEEDYSQVKLRLDELKRNGVEDLERYFTENPLELRRLAGLVRVLNLNRTARRSAGIADNLENPGLNEVFSAETYPIFLQQVLTIARGGLRYSGESTTTAGDGRRRHYMLQWMVMPGHEKDYSGVTVSAIDVTEAKEAEAALRQSEFKFATAFRSSPDALIISSMVDGRFIDVNASFLQISGYDRDEIIGNPMLASEIWQDPRQRQQLLALLRTQGEVRDFRARFRTRTGKQVQVSISSEPIVLEREPCLLSIARDVTQLEKTRRALIESEEHYRTLVEAATDGIFIIQDGLIRFANSSLERISGYGAEEIVGRPFLEFVAESDRDRVEEIYTKRLRGEEVPRHYELLTVNKSGKTVEVEVDVNPFLFKGQSAFMVFMRDISDQKLSQKNILENEEKFRRLFESINEAIFVHPLMEEGFAPFVEVNDVACDRYGYTREELLTMTAADLSAPADTEMRGGRSGRRELKAGRQLVFEAEHVTRSGRCFPVEISSSLFRLQGREYILSLARDITERRQSAESMREWNRELEANVRRRTAELEAANHDLESFAHSISHDLRAPLRHIDGFARLLRSNLGELPEQANHYFERIIQASARMHRMIDDLMEFSRIGRCRLKRTVVDLDALVKEVASELRPEPGRPEMDWRIGKLGTVVGDSGLLHTVFENLLGNAVKFTRNEKVPRVAVSRENDTKGNASIRIEDNGVGFDPAYTHKLFDVFQRLHDDKDFTGNGIGLANVKRIVERLGGRVSAEGRMGEGAVFTVTMPGSGGES